MRHQESLHAFLSRRAGQDWDRVRQALELWTSRHRGSGWKQTLKKFNGGNLTHERGAFWEIYLSEVFHQLALEPMPAGRRERTPGFRLTGPMGPHFVEGVTICLAEAEDVARLAPVYDRINEGLKDPRFTLSCDPVRIAKPTDELLEQLVTDLSSWLRSINPEDFPDPWMTRYLRGRHAKEGGLLWQAGGWALEFWTIPVARASEAVPRNRILGTYSWTGVLEVRDHLKIRQALAGKAVKYEEQSNSAPYVVALLSSRTTSDEHEVGSALFDLAIEHADMILTRRINPKWFADLAPDDEDRPMTEGLWLGTDGPRRTNVSAVIAAAFINPYSSGKEELQIWHNPWADHPLGDFLPFRSHRVDLLTGEWRVSPPTMKPWEILGVPEGWPEL
jgi:hypothetical protein